MFGLTGFTVRLWMQNMSQQPYWSSKAVRQQPCLFLSLSFVSLISLLKCWPCEWLKTLLDCAGVSVSADTQKNERTVKQGTSKKWREERREETVSIFLNNSVHLLPEKKKTFLVSTYQMSKLPMLWFRRVSQCLTFLLDSDRRKPNDWLKCLTNP